FPRKKSPWSIPRAICLPRKRATPSTPNTSSGTPTFPSERSELAVRGFQKEPALSEPSGVIQRLLEELAELPGIGPKSAERIAHFLLAGDRRHAVALAEALHDVAEKIRPCKECFNLTDQERCPICSDPRRDAWAICVVETP